MLKKYLEGAVGDLKQLYKLSEDDILDIKQANHDAIFGRVATKERLIETFEAKKRAIDEQISRKASQNNGAGLDSILNINEKQLLEELKTKLFELKKINRRYARLVVSVGTFYSSLLEKMIPTEMEGYETVIRQSASFLEIKG
jgi:hypothetical protein